MSAKVPTVRPRDTRRNGPQYMGSSPMKPPHKWTPEEDELLRLAVQEIGARHWKLVAERVPGRNHVQCLQRYLRVLQPGLKKGHWTPEEDLKLRTLAKKGFTSWIEAAEQIPGRSAKQCRDRWRNHLESNIKHGPWEPEEDALLLELHAKHGNRWAAIARCIPGRTENAVKIHCKSLMSRRGGASQSKANSEEYDVQSGDNDSETATSEGHFVGKTLGTDSEDDPEATTDDLSSISPLPSPMGLGGQWVPSWTSPTNVSANGRPTFTIPGAGFGNQQHAPGGVLRTNRLQSFPPPMLATSSLMLRRSSFPAVQGVPQQGSTNIQSTGAQRHSIFPPLDTTGFLSDGASLLDAGGHSPIHSPTNTSSYGSGHATTNTFNGAIPLSYRVDIPPLLRTSSEFAGDKLIVPNDN